MNKVIAVQQDKKTMDFLDENEKCPESLDENSLSKNSSSRYMISFELPQTCPNQKCKEILLDIERTQDDIEDLEKKLLMIDKAKTEEFIDISDKLTKVCKEIDELQPATEVYQGKNLEHENYEGLAKIENNLIKLLGKVKNKINNIEIGVLKDSIPKPVDRSTICIQCENNEIDCLLYPCMHLIMCSECVKGTLKCPFCLKYIEYYEKIYLPNAD